MVEILEGGYHDGLTIAAVLTEGEIKSFLDDPDAIEAMNIPLDAGEPEKDLFKKSGAIGGLKLVLEGNWLDERSAY